MDTFRIFTTSDGALVQIGDGAGAVPHRGDEIQVAGMVLVVERRRLDLDTTPPEWRLYAARQS